MHSFCVDLTSYADGGGWVKSKGPRKATVTLNFNSILLHVGRFSIQPPCNKKHGAERERQGHVTVQDMNIEPPKCAPLTVSHTLWGGVSLRYRSGISLPSTNPNLNH